MGSQEIVEGGVYLESVRSRLGTGDTAKDTSMMNYWQAYAAEDDQVKLVLLDMNGQPSIYEEYLPLQEFDQRFVHQPDWKPPQIDLKKVKADKIAARGDRHLEKKEYLSAEYEFSQALQIQSDNVRANYGLGRTYLETGEEEKARQAFEKLSGIDEVLEPQHKHIFNDCGMQLRKLGSFGEAASYYRRALKIGRDDENLWFNLGRALFEGGEKREALLAIKKALEINPDLTEAKNYLSHMNRNQG